MDWDGEGERTLLGVGGKGGGSVSDLRGEEKEVDGSARGSGKSRREEEGSEAHHLFEKVWRGGREARTVRSAFRPVVWTA